MTATANAQWTYWKAFHGDAPEPFTLLRFERATGWTERWTGSEWVDTGATITKPVNSGDLGYAEIPEHEAMAITSPRAPA